MPSGAPPPTANPSEVRAYLTRALTHYHSFTEDYSQKVAERWPCGRGWDLYRLEVPDYQKLWGKEIGFYLYESVQEDIRTDWRQSPEGIACIYMWAFTVSLASTFAIHGFCLAPTLELGATIRRVCLAVAPLTCYGYASKERNAKYWFPVGAIGLVVGFVLTLVSS